MNIRNMKEIEDKDIAGIVRIYELHAGEWHMMQMNTFTAAERTSAITYIKSEYERRMNFLPSTKWRWSIEDFNV